MSFMPVLSSNSNEANWNNINNAFRDIESREVTEIFKDDTGTRRVLIGKGADGFYGLKVSKPTFDVYTTTDANLAFNSDQNAFKIVSKGTGTLVKAVSTTSGTLTIPHGLSYTPAIIGYVAGDGTSPGNPTPYLSISLTTGSINLQIECYATATNVVFKAYTPSGGSLYATAFSFPVTYYLLQETAN